MEFAQMRTVRKKIQGLTWDQTSGYFSAGPALHFQELTMGSEGGTGYDLNLIPLRRPLYSGAGASIHTSRPLRLPWQRARDSHTPASQRGGWEPPQAAPAQAAGTPSVPRRPSGLVEAIRQDNIQEQNHTCKQPNTHLHTGDSLR